MVKYTQDALTVNWNQIRLGVENQSCLSLLYKKCLHPGQNDQKMNLPCERMSRFTAPRLVCVVNFLLPSAPWSSIDSLLSEARVICITYSPLALPVASSTVCSERLRPSWKAQLLGHVDSPVHGRALIALVYAGSGCVRSSLLSVPQFDNSLSGFLFLSDLQMKVNPQMCQSHLLMILSGLKKKKQ